MEHDQPTRRIVEFAASMASLDLGDAAISAVVRVHLDAVGCALGGFSAEPSRIARELAGTAVTTSGCSVFGITERVVPEQAVFANVTMVRQLDFNDTFGGDRSTGGGHPSDMIPAVIAAAEVVGAGGREAIRGIFLAYEVFAALEESYPLAAAGWDHSGPFTAVGSAVGAGLVFGLSSEQLANATSLALTPSMALLCTRKGELSNWKGCASAHGAMSGIFAARLAKAGMSGPKAPFEGVGGLHEQVAQKSEFAVGELHSGRSAVERSSFKCFPAVIYAQGIIEPLLSLYGQLSPDEIDEISVETYEIAWRNAGGGSGERDREEKWNPKTRETADHSLPYIVAICLVDGEVTADSFSSHRLGDPALREIMRKISVRERADLSARFPGEQQSEIKLKLRDGRVLELSSKPALGGPSNPMSDEQLSAKFERLSSAVLDEGTAAALQAILWDLAELPALGELTQHYRALKA